MGLQGDGISRASTRHTHGSGVNGHGSMHATYTEPLQHSMLAAVCNDSSDSRNVPGLGPIWTCGCEGKSHGTDT